MAIGLPCLNPNCKSHGKPHPNCRCYQGLAEGGEATLYCAQGKPHMPTCEYYQPEEPPEGPVAASVAHGGASMLFGHPKSPYFGAFGSKGLTERLAGDETSGRVLHHLARVKKGSKAIEKGIGSLFGTDKADIEDPDEKDMEHIKDYVANGGVDAEILAQAQQQHQPEGYAEGGMVGKKEDPLSSVFPAQNILLNTAKARVSHYLNSQRPQDIQQKLPFDLKNPQTQQKKEYDKAVKLAAAPLSILKEMKDGSLTPSQVKHFAQMWPELHTELSKKMTEHITKAQLAQERPSYGRRQAMSMFMGTALDSTMTPQSIQAAQSMFVSKAAQAQQQQKPPTKKAKNTAPLSKTSDPYQTANQAAEARQKE